MAKGKILIVGSYNIDLTANVKQFPKPGETVFGSRFLKGIGGKGANQAIAAARAAGSVSFAGRVGQDAFGEEAIENLRREGINTDRLSKDCTTPTGTALILVNELGENQITVVSGANYRLMPEDIGRIDFTEFAWVVVQMELPFKTMKAAVTLGKQAGCKIILNPAPAVSEIRELLPLIDVVTPNQTEAELLSEISVRSEAEAEKAANVLLERGAKHVIITLGRKGSYYAAHTKQGINTHYFPAIPVDAVDTTGAGDCFNGALAAALAEGKEMSDAIEFAIAAASLSVTKVGAGESMPLRMEIESMLLKAKTQ